MNPEVQGLNRADWSPKITKNNKNKCAIWWIRCDAECGCQYSNYVNAKCFQWKRHSERKEVTRGKGIQCAPIFSFSHFINEISMMNRTQMHSTAPFFVATHFSQSLIRVLEGALRLHPFHYVKYILFSSIGRQLLPFSCHSWHKCFVYALNDLLARRGKSSKK